MTTPYLRVVLLSLLVISLAGCRTSRSDSASPVAGSESDSDTALQLRAEAGAHYAAATIYALNENFAAAGREYEAATRKDPDNEALVMEVSRRLMQMRQPEIARQIVERTTARPGASGDLYARLGFIYSQLGQTADAIAANRRALTLQPESFAIRNNLFLNHVQARQSAEALEVLDAAARRPEITPEQLLELVGLYGTFIQQFPTQREVASARALETLRRVDEAKIPAATARLKLADRYYQFGDATNSTRLYLKLTEDYTEIPALRELVRGRLVDLYLRQKQTTNAVVQLEQIIRENPSNEQAYFTLGRLASEQQDWTNAVAYLEKAVLFGPKLEQAHYDLVAAQLALDQPTAALATLETARLQFPESFAVEYLAGMARFQQEEFALAVTAFAAAERAAERREPERLNPLFHFQYGAACERAGDHATAVKQFEKCLALDPEFPEALNYLGYMWADRGENLERARELIERALKIQPENAAYLDSMGWVLYRLKRHPEALEYMLRAVNAESTADPTVLDHLGDVYAALNQLAEARAAWTKSLSLKPDEAVKKKLEAGAAK